ncbi:class I SAM-dependent methyltransferase [Actinophytocola sp. KF-1]
MRKSSPSSTAQNVALARAHLTWLGVLDDRFAAAMLRPAWASMARALRWPPVSRLGHNRMFAWLAARTRFFDDAVTGALDAGVRQVVVMAAGYDSRAWRLARPGVRFFEVDHPATQHDKRGRAPDGGPAYVPVEFGRDPVADALVAAGFRAGEPSVFTVEGVTMYLTEPQVRDLLSTVRGLGAEGSRLAVNFGLGVEAADSTGSRAVARLARLHFAVSGEHVTYRPSIARAEELLAETGWTAGATLTAPELVRWYVSGSGLPTSDIRPTAFALTATAA